MTIEAISLGALHDARDRLIVDIAGRLTNGAAAFLLSMHNAEPDFTAIGLPQAAALPAINWKLLNLRRLIEEQPAKHAEQRNALEQVLRR